MSRTICARFSHATPPSRLLSRLASTDKGKLLDVAEAENFDVLVTGDLSLEFQQNLSEEKWQPFRSARSTGHWLSCTLTVS